MNRMDPSPPLSPPTAATDAKVRVFVVDDHELMRRSMVAALERESDLIVCGQAGDAPEAIVAIADCRPDLVITDIQLKSSSGLDIIKALRARLPALPIVAVTMFNVQHYSQLAREAGASAFAAKDGPEQLIVAVRQALGHS
ncbi:MAG: response regulator transcription factor [Verrucomicrobia bacterium]|nr:response regulator transcription factor [Verrucomicrobiota bacterium]MDE3098913.1 response regulator transcription factor [Verrucomicrobiota bacterium]